MSKRIAAAKLLTTMTVICLVACGGGSSGGPAAPAAPSLPGVASGDSWSLRFDGFNDIGITGNYGRAVPLAALEGSFTGLVGPVNAVMQPFGNCFTSEGPLVRFGGTRSGGNLDMQSQPVEGQVVRITGLLTETEEGRQALSGTYAITGGCGGGRTGRVIGNSVNLTGTWKGTMGAVPAVFQLQMAKTPAEDGSYVLSGAATLTDTPCLNGAVITRHARGRVLVADVAGDGQRLELKGEISQDHYTMHVDFVLVAGTCPELARNSGRLVRQ